MTERSCHRCCDPPYALCNDAAGDLDGDGYSNLQAYLNGWNLVAHIDPYDGDGDRIPDAVEGNGVSVQLADKKFAFMSSWHGFLKKFFSASGTFLITGLQSRRLNAWLTFATGSIRQPLLRDCRLSALVGVIAW